MDLTTLARVTGLLVPSGALQSGDQTVVSQLITSVSMAAERYMDRAVQVAARTEYATVEPGQCVWRLRAYPVTVLSQVRYDPLQAWDTTHEVSASLYQSPIYEPAGALRFRAPLSMEHEGTALKVVYTGGMGATVADMITNYPDMVQAIEQQVVYQWQRRTDLGVQSIASEAGTVSQPALFWLPSVIDVLGRFRRWVA